MRRVVVTGIGAITPLGNDVKSFWTAITNGVSGVNEITHFDTTGFECQIAAEVKNFEPEKYIDRKSIRRMDIFSQFALAAAGQALEDSKLDLSNEDLNRIGVIVGSGIGGIKTLEDQHKIFLEKGPDRISPFFIPMLISNMAAGNISIYFKLKGPNSCAVTACASGNHSMGDSFRIIARDEADVMVTGGAEAAITPISVAGFCAAKALSKRNSEPTKASRPFDRDRDGFVMGEGSGILVFEELEHAKKRGAKIYAEVIGYGLTSDAYHMTAPAPCGEGGARAMQSSLDDAKISPDKIDYINAHGTSTQLGDIGETDAIKTVFKEHAYKLAVSSTKSMTGHLLGAAGGVEFITLVLAIGNSIIPPTINLDNPDPKCDLDYVPNKAREKEVNFAMSNAFGFGGHNASIIAKKYID